MSREPYADIGPAQAINMQTFPGRNQRKWACPRMRAGESNAGSALDPVMASPQVLAGILGLLFVSALPQVLGVRSGLERRVHSGTKQSGLREGGWDGPGAWAQPSSLPVFLRRLWPAWACSPGAPAAFPPGAARAGPDRRAAVGRAVHRGRGGFCALQVSAGAGRPGMGVLGALRSPGGGAAGGPEPDQLATRCATRRLGSS